MKKFVLNFIAQVIFSLAASKGKKVKTSIDKRL